MIKNSENFLNDVNANYLNLIETMKNEKDPKKLLLIEKELNKMNTLSRALTNYINYYKMKELKSRQ
ncbi:MAG: hypothetical protein ACK50E_05255 [Bacteroidota bacterium]